jgi:flagellar protein FliO/FliZ
MTLLVSAVMVAPGEAQVDATPATRPAVNEAPSAASPSDPIAAPIAPATAAPIAPAGQFDDQSIRRHGTDEPATSMPSTALPGTTAPSVGVLRVVLSLSGVVILILALRWCARKVFPTAGVGRATRAIQVLSRTPLGPRQQLILVQIGRRLVLVGDSGTNLSPLCQISNPAEVASLTGEIRGEHAAAARRFSSAFGRASEQFEDSTDRAAIDSVDLLRDSVRDTATAYERDRSQSEPSLGAEGSDLGEATREEFPAEIDRPGANGVVVDTVAARGGGDESLETARQELGGLGDKIRLLSRQLK